MSLLSSLPYRQPIGEVVLPNGQRVGMLITRPWQEWLRDLLRRVGGTDATTVDDLETLTLFADGLSPTVAQHDAEVDAVLLGVLLETPQPLARPVHEALDEGLYVAELLRLRAMVAHAAIEAVFQD